MDHDEMPKGRDVERARLVARVVLHEIVVECFEVVAAEPNFLVSIGGGCVKESRPFGGVLRGP